MSKIGFQHGTQAKTQVLRTRAFYADLFKQSAGMEWPQVQQLALKFEPTIREKWPAYLEEMAGTRLLSSTRPPAWTH